VPSARAVPCFRLDDAAEDLACARVAADPFIDSAERAMTVRVRQDVVHGSLRLARNGGKRHPVLQVDAHRHHPGQAAVGAEHRLRPRPPVSASRSRR